MVLQSLDLSKEGTYSYSSNRRRMRAGHDNIPGMVEVYRSTIVQTLQVDEVLFNLKTTIGMSKVYIGLIYRCRFRTDVFVSYILKTDR